MIQTFAEFFTYPKKIFLSLQSYCYVDRYSNSLLFRLDVSILCCFAVVAGQCYSSLQNTASQMPLYIALVCVWSKVMHYIVNRVSFQTKICFLMVPPEWNLSVSFTSSDPCQPFCSSTMATTGQMRLAL